MKRILSPLRIWPVLLLWTCLALGAGACVGDDVNPAPDASGLGDADISDASSGDTADVAEPREVGEPCFGPQDCVEGASCIGTGVADEYRCMRNCSQRWRICQDGSVCTPRLNSPVPICFTGGTIPRGQPCQTNLQCQPGTLCVGRDQELYCLEACHQLDQQACPSDMRCEVIESGGKGLCRPKLGASCAATDHCADNLACSEELGEGFEGLFRAGFCTQAGCETDADCPLDGVCRTTPGTDSPICMATCASDADCRFNQDYRCLTAGYCNQASDPQACESFRSGEDICFPSALVSNL